MTFTQAATIGGRAMLSLGLVLMGALALYYRDFAMQWQPVPEATPARELLALINGVALIVCALLLWWPRARLGSAAVLAFYFLIVWVLVLHLPRVIGGVEAAWNGMAEAGAMGAGALAIALTSAHRDPRWARLALGVCAPVFGVAHFIYADFTASMVPAWIPPSQIFWAYATGWGHVLGGLSLLTNILPRLGAGLYALMLTSFALVLHAPRVLAAPDVRVEWTMLAVALTLSGAAWICAGSLSTNPIASRGERVP